MATEVAKKESSAVAVAQFEDLGGLGFEETTSQDMAVPFLRILAQLSPQVNKRDGAYVEGAEAGMMFNTVANKAYDGEKGVTVVPCYYNRRFVEWAPREKGGGYFGSYHPDDPITNTTTKNERGEDILPNGNILTNTAQFFVILLDEDGPQRCLITMSSTQLKKARKWVTQMQALTAQGKNGSYTLPMMSHKYLLSTVAEANDKGNWFGWEISKVGPISLGDAEEANVFEMAVAFAKSVKAGEVEVKETAPIEPKDKGTPPDDDVPF
jgi:hypothetical protein